MLVYEETPWRGNVRAPSEPISAWDEARVMGAWRAHLGNRGFLEFMSREGTFEEKGQARAELAICARKMAFWERHPRWSRARAEGAIAEQRGMWGR